MLLRGFGCCCGELFPICGPIIYEKVTKLRKVPQKKHQKVTKASKKHQNTQKIAQKPLILVVKQLIYTVQLELIFNTWFRRGNWKIVSFWGNFAISSKDPNPNWVQKVCKTGPYMKKLQKWGPHHFVPDHIFWVHLSLTDHQVAPLGSPCVYMKKWQIHTGYYMKKWQNSEKCPRKSIKK